MGRERLLRNAAPRGDSPRKRGFDVDRDWPPVPVGGGPPGFAADRERIYDESGRLTGGPAAGAAGRGSEDTGKPALP